MTRLGKNKWVVLRVQPRKEQQVMAWLERASISFYLPTIRKFKILKSNKEQIQVPLFTGYIFVMERPGINDTKLNFVPGTSGLLMVGGQKAQVTDAEIETLEKVCKLRTPPEVVNDMVVGEMITIKSGSLKGISGIVKQVSGKNYIYIESGINGMMIKLKLSDSIVDRAEKIENK